VVVCVEDADYQPPSGDLQSFENEWVEVEVTHPNKWRKLSEANNTSQIPRFLATTVDEGFCQDNRSPGRSRSTFINLLVVVVVVLTVCWLL
jgi:hypothetical protein